jgi:hypothetical protein
MDTPFWMIWNPRGHAPTVSHSHPETAKREAERLARANPGQEFYVLRCEGKCQVNDIRWEHFDDTVPF